MLELWCYDAIIGSFSIKVDALLERKVKGRTSHFRVYKGTPTAVSVPPAAMSHMQSTSCVGVDFAALTLFSQERLSLQQYKYILALQMPPFCLTAWDLFLQQMGMSFGLDCWTCGGNSQAPMNTTYDSVHSRQNYNTAVARTQQTIGRVSTHSVCGLRLLSGVWCMVFDKKMCIDDLDIAQTYTETPLQVSTVSLYENEWPISYVYKYTNRDTNTRND